MKETFYFSHDYNARSDSKIKRLIMKHGAKGYGIFWWIIEDLYQNANALHLDYDCIAYELREDSETVKSIIENFDLFIIKEGKISSKSVQDRLDAREKKSAKARESAEKRWGKKNANAMQTHSDSNAIKERKVKESKVNKSKEIIIKEKTPVSLINIAEKEFTDEFIEKMQQKYNLNSDSIKKQQELFLIHWTAPKNTRKGEVELWSTKETFDIKRRFYTWLNNNETWNKSSGSYNSNIQAPGITTI